MQKEGTNKKIQTEGTDEKIKKEGTDEKIQKEGTDEKITSMKEREGNEKDIKYFEKYKEKIYLMNEIMNQRLI